MPQNYLKHSWCSLHCVTQTYPLHVEPDEEMRLAVVLHYERYHLYKVTIWLCWCMLAHNSPFSIHAIKKKEAEIFWTFFTTWCYVKQDELKTHLWDPRPALQHDMVPAPVETMTWGNYTHFVTNQTKTLSQTWCDSLLENACFYIFNTEQHHDS